MLRHAWFIATLVAVPLAAQPSGPQGDTWESIAKLPDFGGLWEVTFGGGPRGGAEPPAFTPEYAAKLQAFQAASQSGEIEDGPAANCVPNGMPSIMTQPYPIEILFTPGKVTILIEAYAQWRQIFTDGREHPEDPDLTFNGHSIGHWEGEHARRRHRRFHDRYLVRQPGPAPQRQDAHRRALPPRGSPIDWRSRRRFTILKR